MFSLEQIVELSKTKTVEEIKELAKLAELQVRGTPFLGRNV
jgi:hypothetical protein